MLDLVARGDVVLPGGVLRGGYVSVAGGRVVGVQLEDPGVSRERLNADGAWIFPGAIDAQVHSRSQKDREDFRFSTRAALAGGVTTIVDMPYDEGLLIADAASVKQKAADIAAQAVSDVALYGTIRPSDGVIKIAEQVRAGVCAFKFSTFGTHPERFPRIGPQLLAEAFAEVAKHGLAAGVHNEIEEIVIGETARIKATGRTDYLVHGETHNRLSELLAIVDIYETGAFTGCRAHVVHCSQARGIEICSHYRRQGYDSTTEVCIHYLAFDEEETVRTLGGLAKGNPPLRSGEREALWRHLAAGNIDLVSTDHVAWSLERKNHPDMFTNSAGGPSLEVLVPVLLKGCVERSIDLAVAARVLSHNPARHFRLTSSKGALAVGGSADFSIIDPSYAPWRVADSVTVSDWSLYDGMALPQIKATFLRGQKVWDGATVTGEPGFGRFVTPRSK
ncbi:amidohydrolase family protein [Mesorhizobium sp. M1312]|uniref:dihydroorotase n=1 Tax=unclassified Mesorhizobium TaxID=325217 RepID=UPI00333A184C